MSDSHGYVTLFTVLYTSLFFDVRVYLMAVCPAGLETVGGKVPGRPSSPLHP